MPGKCCNACLKTNFVMAEKCDFHVGTVSFLGFVLEKGQVKLDPEKVKAVVEWPVPSSR